MRKTLIFIIITLSLLSLSILLIVHGISPYILSSRLCDAINYGSIDEAIVLINKSKNVNCPSSPMFMREFYNMAESDIELPLVLACNKGEYDLVEPLLEKGADPNKFLKGNWSPIEAAFVQGNENRLQIAQQLLSYGANVNLYGSGTSALFLEMRNMLAQSDMSEQEEELFEDCTLLLLDNGSDLYDEKGYSVIHYLASGNKYPFIEKIVSYYDSIDETNEKGETPLMSAIESESVQCVEYLINKGADPNIKNDEGKNSFDLAHELKNEVIIELLNKIEQQ